MQPYQARNVMFALGVSGEAFKAGCRLAMNLVKLFCDTDATLAEINPLVVTGDGTLVAADGKLTTDDNAAFRQEQIEPTREQYGSPLEYEAARQGFPYLEFDGDIGLMCAGAGLTNTVYDLICDAGGTVANYLEFGGPNYRRAVEAMDFTLRSKPKVILIVTFGTIARADVMAEGIAEAIKTHQPTVPIITAIRGTNEEQAAGILRSIGLDPLSDTETAVRNAVNLCKAGGQ
jgi:succinyl-CoA synthetase beta subunit